MIYLSILVALILIALGAGLYLSDKARRGLILHHEREATFSKGAPTPWIGPELLPRIEELIKKLDPEAPEASAMLVDYRDSALTGGKQYWGALQPLVDKGEEMVRDSHWVVLVQEPMTP